MAFLLRLDCKLQKYFGAPQAPAAQRKGTTRQSVSPFAQAAYKKQPRPSCNGGWQPAASSRHANSQSFDGSSSLVAVRKSPSGSLSRAVTAPEGSVKHFLDREFMATLQSQDRYDDRPPLAASIPTPVPDTKASPGHAQLIVVFVSSPFVTSCSWVLQQPWQLKRRRHSFCISYSTASCPAG